jgi:hypothetical protein
VSNSSLFMRITFPWGAGPWHPLAHWKHAWSDPVDERSLEYALLVGWVHGFLWGMDDKDRLFFVAEVSRVKGATLSSLKEAVARLKLKGWSDFPLDYPQAPFGLECSRRETHLES